MSCGACTGGCTGSCTGNCGRCGGGCTGCTGTCTGSCAGCHGCSGCGSCGVGCGGCTGCSGCGSCSGCGGACSNSCSGCSGSCSGGCSSCTGSCSGSCTGCTGTCAGDCDNACKSSSAAEAIANLGTNIQKGNFINPQDFITLKDSIHNELHRRNKPIPDDNYINNPIQGVKIAVEHSQKIFNNTKQMDSNRNHNVTLGDMVKTESLEDCVTYTQLLMNQNTK